MNAHPYDATDWTAFLSGLSAFAGTLFALVLAARQIRGPAGETAPRRTARAYYIDSIAVTTELGAAASLALLVTIEATILFSVFVALIALVGITLATATAVAWSQAAGDFWPDRWATIRVAALIVGNGLPITCYVVVSLYATRALSIDSAMWGYAAAVAWLTFSGTFQAVLWYARIWERPRTSTVES